MLIAIVKIFDPLLSKLYLGVNQHQAIQHPPYSKNEI